MHWRRRRSVIHVARGKAVGRRGAVSSTTHPCYMVREILVFLHEVRAPGERNSKCAQKNVFSFIRSGIKLWASAVSHRQDWGQTQSGSPTLLCRSMLGNLTRLDQTIFAWTLHNMLLNRQKGHFYDKTTIMYFDQIRMQFVYDVNR